MAVAAGTDPSPFVGRGREVAGLHDRISAARAGGGGLVLVAGPAGIGKTRTVEEAVRAAPAVVWGRAVDDPGAPPLWPWRRVLRARPEVAAAVADALAEVDLVREPAADPEAARFRFVAAATEALLRSADPDGLVVVLEDLHWADDTSLRLLRHLAGELHGSRLLVVGTYRDPGGADGGRIDRTLPDLMRSPGTEVLTLAPLTEDDVRAYLLGTARAAVPEDEVRAVHRRSGGNPLYLRAVARSPSRGPDAGTPVGSELRHAVRATLASLDRPVVDLLVTAAVLGEDVDGPLLAAVTGRPVPEVRSDLDTAVRAGVLVAVPDAPGRRRFLHAVVRDGIYADLGPSEREALHRRAAEAWEDSVGVDDSTAGVVAGHWLRAAADPPALRRAASWARRASVAATRALAFDEAARFLGMALAASVRAGCSEEERAVLLVDLATAEFRADHFADSLRLCVEASELSARCGRGDLLAAAALVVHDVSASEFLPTFARLAERALDAADHPPAVRSRLMSQLASALGELGRLAAAEEWSVRALALAEECGDPEALLDAVRARGKASPSALSPAERLRLGRLAVAHAETTGQPLAALWGHKWRIDAAYELADMPSLLDDLAGVTQLAQRTWLPLVRWHDLRLRSSIAALLGRFAEAEALNEEAGALAAAELTQDFSAVGMSGAFRLQHALVTGDVSGLADHMTLLKDAGDVPMTAVSRGQLALLLGRREDAATEYAGLRRRLGEPGMVAMPHFVINLVPLVEAFEDTGTAAFLRDVLDRLPLSQGGAGVYCSGAIRRPLGRLEILLGRLDEAVTHLEEALALDERCGARPLVVHDLIGLATALLDRGDVGDVARAAGLARSAAEEARRLGMPGPLRAAAALRDRAAAADRAADPLTSRERQIAGLVAAALTNRQIADRLVLSERTVESHVRNILAKLGVANRTEIATVTLGDRRR